MTLGKKGHQFIKRVIRREVHKYDETGFVGDSRPRSRKAAVKEAVEVAFERLKRKRHKAQDKRL